MTRGCPVPYAAPTNGRTRTRLTIVGAALSLLLAAPASAQLAVTEAPGVRLIYIDGTQSFLVPYAARTFFNSLEFQKKLFDFTPSEDITVLLVDFKDSGDASATAVPRNAVTVQIAPLSFAFETIAGNERLNIIMNHELVHVAAMDQAARPRSVLPPSVRRQGGAHRRSARVGAVLLPHDAASGGAALVSRRHRHVPRHLDGGRPRPRAGRLRRDGVPLDGEGRRPLLRSARPRVGRHEDRLSAPDQLVSLRHAVHALARAHVFTRAASSRGSRATTAAARTTPRSSARCSARRSSRRGRGGSPTSTRSSRRTSKRSGSTRSLRTPTWPGARSGRCRARTTTPPSGRSTRPSTIPASSHTSARFRPTRAPSSGSSTSRDRRSTP